MEDKQKRNKHFSVAVTEEVKTDLQLLARYKGISMNELFFQMCSNEIEKHGAEITRMKEIFKEG